MIYLGQGVAYTAFLVDIIRWQQGNNVQDEGFIDGAGALLQLLCGVNDQAVNCAAT